VSQSEAIRTFARITKDYCSWCEGDRASDPGQQLSEATRHVARLYAAALDLPEVELVDHPEPPSMEYEAWRAIFDSFGALPFSYYLVVLDPSIDGLEGVDKPGAGDLADDLADIYRDLIEGLWLLHNGCEQAAVWHWRFSFRSHWGQHATSALRAMHCVEPKGG